jgi:predicted nucleic acid-binding protein
VIVVDASAIVEVLLNTTTGAALRPHLLRTGESLHVPHLTDVEVLQALRRYSIAKVLDRARASEAFDDYAAMPLNRYPHSILLPRVWELRHNLTAYGAVYIALAEALRATLVTCDQALGSVSGHNATVEIFRRPVSGD